MLIQWNQKEWVHKNGKTTIEAAWEVAEDVTKNAGSALEFGTENS